jgi:GTP-binding protein Era
MQQQVLDSLSESDAVLLLFDAAQARGGLGQGDRYVARLVAESGTPAIACLNKVDLLRDRSEVLPMVGEVSGLAEFEEIFPLSAAEGLNVEPLMGFVVELLSPGPRYFPEGIVTDYPESLILAEYVREKALGVLREEVPHAVAVEIDEVERKDKRYGRLRRHPRRAALAAHDRARQERPHHQTDRYRGPPRRRASSRHPHLPGPQGENHAGMAERHAVPGAAGVIIKR